jgi:hypothetical protein
VALTDINRDTIDATGELARAGLLRDRGLIAGEWVPAKTGAALGIEDWLEIKYMCLVFVDEPLEL